MWWDIVNDDFVACLLVNLSVKKFENLSTFGEVMDNIVVPCFFDSQCIMQNLPEVSVFMINYNFIRSSIYNLNCIKHH